MHNRRRVGSALALILMACLLVSNVFLASAGSSREQEVYSALRNTGRFNNAAICGLMANIQSESNFDPTATSRGGSYGLCQWTGSRKADLANYCSSNSLNQDSVDGQIAFLVFELQKSYSSVYKTLTTVANTADGAYNAAYRFCYDFERPASKSSRSTQRGNLAKNTYWPRYGNALNLTNLRNSDVWVVKLDGAWVSVLNEDRTTPVNYTGVCKNEYGWWRVENGKVDFTADSIYKNDYGWWKTTGGKVTFQETGVFENENGWWYVKNSKVDFGYTGLADNQYGTWYIVNGKVKFSYSGTVDFDGQTFTVAKGKVIA